MYIHTCTYILIPNSSHLPIFYKRQHTLYTVLYKYFLYLTVCLEYHSITLLRYLLFMAIQYPLYGPITESHLLTDFQIVASFLLLEILYSEQSCAWVILLFILGVLMGQSARNGIARSKEEYALNFVRYQQILIFIISSEIL